MAQLIDLRFFDAASIVAIVGQNPEMADIENPRGYIYAVRWFVQGEAHDGSRANHTHIFADAADALRLAERIRAAVLAGKKLDSQRWVWVNPAYGSDAYIKGGYELMQLLSEREEEGVR